VNALRESSLRLAVLDGRLAVCRLDASEAPPPIPDGFFSVTYATDELSVVCREDSVPEGARCEKGWRALKLEGPFEFTEVGVLASVAAPLAGAGVSTFAVSTFDTDYVLVKEERLATAMAALQEQGHEVADGETGVVVGPSDNEDFLWKMLYEAVHWGPEETGPKPPPEEVLSDARLQRYVAGWGRPGDFAVAREAESGREIGAAWYRIFPEDEPGYGFVDGRTPELAIAVSEGHRGGGVGGALISALTEAARTRGFDALSLSVQKSNPGAERLYERNGFVVVRDGGGDLVMKLEFS
jgi:uncharacterized protein